MRTCFDSSCRSALAKPSCLSGFVHFFPTLCLFISHFACVVGERKKNDNSKGSVPSSYEVNFVCLLTFFMGFAHSFLLRYCCCCRRFLLLRSPSLQTLYVRNNFSTRSFARSLRLIGFKVWPLNQSFNLLSAAFLLKLSHQQQERQPIKSDSLVCLRPPLPLLRFIPLLLFLCKSE